MKDEEEHFVMREGAGLAKLLERLTIQCLSGLNEPTRSARSLAPECYVEWLFR